MPLTINQLCETATQLEYNICIRSTYLLVSKKHFPHVYKTVPLNDFSLDQEHASDYALLVAYYWVRGYHLKYGDDGKILLQRAMHHPSFDGSVWVEGIFDYHSDADWDLDQLHTVLLQWIRQTEEDERHSDERERALISAPESVPPQTTLTTLRDIRKAIARANEGNTFVYCLYESRTIRICDVRMRNKQIEVEFLGSGGWVTPSRVFVEG